VLPLASRLPEGISGAACHTQTVGDAIAGEITGSVSIKPKGSAWLFMNQALPL